MFTNIVIPVHNRPEHTRQTIDSLIKHTDWSAVRLFLIDDCSDVMTNDLVMSYRKFVETTGGIIQVNQENIGPGASRNEMVRYILNRYGEGELLYHSDNDVYFTEGWLPTLIGVYEEAYKRGVRLMGASCHPYLQSKEIFPVNTDRGVFQVGIKDAVSGYSQLISLEDWVRYGEFSEDMRRAEKKIMGSEDWEYCQRIVSDGYLVGSMVPEMVYPTGRTNTYGEPATGAETFILRDGVRVI